ncbi:DUF87 domain-containing protein, partial [archaeon]|nr:DUF87 domain-containing protein [archaeon]
ASEISELYTKGLARIERQNVTEYIQNWTGEENKTYVSPLSVTASKSGYVTYLNTSVNQSVNLDMAISMSGLSSVSGCGNLDEAGVYTLSGNVSSTGTCFNVTAENVTIDCGGYEINYSYGGVLGYGVYSEMFNTTVRNCVIKTGSATTSNKHAVLFEGNNANNGTVYNNTIITIGRAVGIRLLEGASSSPSYNVIDSNVIMTSGSFGQGIELYSSYGPVFYGNRMINNNITTSATYAYGAFFRNTADTLFDNNTVLTSGGGHSYALLFQADGAYGNLVTVKNSNIKTTASGGTSVNVPLGILIAYGDQNITIIDSVINATNQKDIYVMDNLDSGSLRLLNVSFNKSDVLIEDSDFELQVEYYLDVHVNSSSGLDIEGANVTIKNNTADVIWSELSNASGWLPTRLNLTEYTQNWTGESNKTYHTNYTFTTFATDYYVGSDSLNLTSSTIYDIELIGAIYERSALGLTTNKNTVNYNENVNLSITIPSENLGSNTLSSVWAVISKPGAGVENVSLEGNVAGGYWNGTYTNTSGVLGDYVVGYYANITTGVMLFEDVSANFSVQNTSISVVPENLVVNTTDVINVMGQINRTNSTGSWSINDNLFLMKINNVSVSSDVYNDSSFVGGTGSEVNVSNVVQLNLSSEGNVLNYNDTYATNGFLSDNYSSYMPGYSGAGGILFDDNIGGGFVGNVTYKFTSVTKFYNASVYVGTQTAADGSDGSGNTSVWYSSDYSSWNFVDSSTTQGVLVGGVLDIDGYSDVYIKIQSDMTGGENPVTNLTINKTSYNYDSLGNYVSGSINLANVTYTTLKWTESLNGGDINVQLRESDDGSAWDSWSSNYTNSLTNDISSFTKDYVQYRAWFETSNLSRTPVLSGINISYFNASTNSTGGYDYNITIPTDTLGPQDLEVSVVNNPTTGIVGANTTSVTVWARTNVTYAVEKNYSQSISNYSVYVNFTRTDTGALVPGDVNISISNSSSLWSYVCSGVTQCVASWLIPTNVKYGNYTINITGSNETGYYINSSNGFEDWLEQRNTTGVSNLENRNISDLSFGTPYSFLHNFTINNTGNASMYDVYVWDANPNADVSFADYTPCTRIYPNQSCDYVLNITLADSTSAGTYEQTLRANWSDNDGSISGGRSPAYFQEFMDIVVESNAVMSLNISDYNLSMQHESNSNFSFLVQSTGTSPVVSTTISFVEGNISAGNNLSGSWINFIPSSIASINPASDSSVIANITVPAQTAPGNYSGQIKVLALAGGTKYLNLTLEVLTNKSWSINPSSDLSNNNTFSLNTAGAIGNYTVTNLGNVNLSFSVGYLPSRTTDYTAIQGLFSQDNTTYIPGSVLNPTKINVSKGGNTTIPVYQLGDDDSWNDIGINITVSNASASPTSYTVQDSWYIIQAPPEVSNIYFTWENIYGNKAEVNKPVVIKMRTTDDISVNTTTNVTKINVTYGGTTVVLNATDLFGVFGEYTGGAGSTTVLNFTANFTPTIAGIHYVVATIYDNGGNSNFSSTYNFTSYATSNVQLSQNISNHSIVDINQDNFHLFYVNYTLNNTGEVYAYLPNITFSKNDSVIDIIPSNYLFSNMSNGSKSSYGFGVNVSEGTPSGTYDITSTARWKNPDNSIGSDSEVLSVIVASNKSFNYSPSSLNLTVSTNEQNSTVLTINNTGNDALTSVSLDCYTVSLCDDFTFSANASGFSIPVGGSRKVNVSLSAPQGLTGGVYVGTINISGSGVSDTVSIQAEVPSSYTWNATPLSVNATKGTSQTGNLGAISISNTGNMPLTFNLSSTNASTIQPNMSTITVPVLSSGSFNINYSAPDSEGSYFEKILITNTSYTPSQLNVSVNLTVTRINTTILSPTSANNLSNVSVGDLIEIHVNATYGDELITNSSNWSASIGGSSCSNLSYEYLNSSVYWNLTCNAPSITDGLTYNLSVTLTHESYGEISQTSTNSIIYRDITPPYFNVTRNNVNLGSNISLQVNVTDNAEVGNVWFDLTYPNASIYNWTNVTNTLMSLSGGNYIFTGLLLNLAGEYLVNYSANDSTGNLNSTLDWFEVNDKYNWLFNLVNYDSDGVNNVNISLRRPNTTTLLVNNVSNSSGSVVLNVNKRDYDLHAKISTDTLITRNINFTNVTTNNITFNLHRLGVDELSETVALHKVFQGIASNSSGLSLNDVSAVFNYSGLSYDNSNELRVVKCASWNYTDRSCLGTWSNLSSSIDKDLLEVTGNSTGFSSYFLAENKCSNGLCEGTYGETTTTCPADCITTSSGTSSSSGGGGGGSSGLRSADLDKIEEIIKSFLNIGGIKLETVSIYKELFVGETTTFRIHLRNTLDSEKTIEMSTDGDIAGLIFFESSSITLESKEERDVLIKIVAPRTAEPGNYDGDLILKSGEEDGSIPVTIRILSPEGKLLDVKIQPLTASVRPGDVLRLQTDLLNLGKTKRVDVQFDLQLLDVETGEIITRSEEAFAVETTISAIKNLTIPEETAPNRYMIKATAYYSNVEQSMQASSIAYIMVQEPFFLRSLVGIPVWVYFLVFLVGVLAIGGISYLRYLDFKKKRFKVKVDSTKLPHPSPHSGFVGKIAESDMRTFVDMNKLQTHTLIAGSTGSGKTVAAQDVVEEALIKKKGVIIFDPTAQWTGFLRKNTDKGMFKRYGYFGMKPKDAKGFNGSIKTISDPYELINMKKYLNRPGEITIFNVSHLTPKQIDVVVASTIEQVFKSEPTEASELKTLIVYDEVHRLLPKFGGSGQGFIQLERGAREFRKWGIGLMLISQVLSDFVGEVKANIGTEIQMGTRYEGDLERVSMKYGEDVLKSVVKEPVGTGMVTNAEYNAGRPYFVAFRPLMHSTKRLTKAELKNYEKYFQETEDLDYQSAMLEKLGVDTLDLKLELKLAKQKVKSGQFRMAEMYLESLRPRFEENWKTLGKKPMHVVKKKIDRATVSEGILKAKAERKKYVSKNPEKVQSFDQEVLDLKKLIEEKKRAGKQTSSVELKLTDLKKRLKPFKGKISASDAKGMSAEVEGLKKEIKGVK